jgi:tetratricopeptide (TPR) repeat protein
MKRCSPLGIALTLVAFTLTARAEDADARMHFERGRDLARAQEWAQAAQEFERSVEIEASIGGLLNLGNAYEKQGRLLSAANAFRRAESIARPVDQERAEEARSRSARIQSRIPTVLVRGAEEHVVKIDGRQVRLGIRVEVDPGRHAVEISSSRKPLQSTDLVVEAGEHVTVVVRQDNAPSVTRNELAASSSAGAPTVAYVAFGAGAAGLITSGALYAMALGSKGKLERSCVAYPSCREAEIDAAREHEDAARTEATGASIALAIGVVALGAGALLFFSTRDRAVTRSAVLQW